MKNFTVLRIASTAIIMMLAAVCSGCALGAVGMVTTIAPAVAAGSAQVIGSQVAMKEGGGTGATQEDSADKCDQLLRAPIGVEEVRKNKDGLIESRQWKIAETSGDPIWIVARTQTENADRDAWQPKPGISKLLFTPPLYQMLKPDEPEYLAYAPTEIVNVSDSEQFDSMVGAFGSGVGTFIWRDRSYTFVLVKQLPCFKPAKEK
ncbi:MAG TPA: hypothetical protein VN865_11570 [Candidatus Acidoferrales bacterium]|nr:hypothetical protein [Candidatus Acidoferrales bacterium]